jgi:hypothetical protein
VVAAVSVAAGVVLGPALSPEADVPPFELEQALAAAARHSAAATGAIARTRTRFMNWLLRSG